MTIEEKIKCERMFCMITWVDLENRVTQTHGHNVELSGGVEYYKSIAKRIF